jgi:hypothetical protein
LLRLWDIPSIALSFPFRTPNRSVLSWCQKLCIEVS